MQRIITLIVIAISPTLASAEPLPVQTIAFDAPSVGRTMKYNIILPADYDNSERRYPVLYLLHGLTSHYQLWAMMNVPENAAHYDLIVVMPDAGNSWYVNWAESAPDQKNDWEDYMVNDLLVHIDTTYRTIATREGRAIGGLSMGGYGAFVLGLRNPDTFCSIGSHSGALGYARDYRRRLEQGLPGPRSLEDAPSTRPMRIIGIDGFSSAAERYPNGRPFTTVEECDAHDPFTLVLDLPAEDRPHIHLDCGTDDSLIAVNREFARLCMENNIPFSYAESPGPHLPTYWSREVAHSMAVQYNVIRRSLAESAAEPAQVADKPPKEEDLS